MNPCKHLPDEILQILFGQLTFTEKLIVRSVCSKWQEQLLPSLLKETTYHLNPSKRSHQTLLDSKIPWKSLKVSTIGIGIRLPAEQKNFITALDLEFDSHLFHFNDCLEFILEFPNVEELSINISESNTAVGPKHARCMRSYKEKQRITNEFIEITKNLVSLSISFPFEKYAHLDQLDEFLKIFSRVKKLKLVQFALKENHDRPETINTREYPCFKYVRKLISNCASTLEILNFKFWSTNILREFLGKIVYAFGKLENATSLKLKQVSFDFENSGLNASNFRILHRFLDSQKNTLKSVGLPWTPYDKENIPCQKLIKIIPSCIQKMFYIHHEHITPDFLDEFKELYSISITTDEKNTEMFYLNNGKSSSVRLLELDGVDCYVEDHFIQNLTETFINLTQLIIQPELALLNSSLQAIIGGCEKLEVLKIFLGDCISDIGVTNIAPSRLRKLLDSRGIYLMTSQSPEVEQNENELISQYLTDGRPISSLKRLRELTLLKSTITDVGIYFGFNFGPTLKKLTFGSDSEVTDWGLHWLAIYNPNVESFHGIFDLKRISSIGKKILRNKFPLTQYTGKFKLEEMKVEEEPRVVVPIDSTSDSDSSD